MNAIAADKVLVELQAKVANYNRDVNNASRNFDLRMRQVGNSSRLAERNVKTATDAMSKQVMSLGRAFTMAFAGGIFAGGAAGLIRSIRGVTREMSDLANAAEMIGVGTEDLQRLRFGLEQTGVSANATDTAMRRFARRIGEAANGGGQLYEVLKANNIQLRNQDGSMRSQVDLLRDYANLIRNAGSHQERLSLAFKAFDVAGSEMVQGLMGDFDDLMGKVEEAGGVIEDELIQRAAEMDTKWDASWRNFEIAAKSAILSVIPYFDQLDSRAEQLFKKIPVVRLYNYMTGGDEGSGTDPVQTLQGRVDFLSQHVEALKAKGEDALEAERQLAIARAALEAEVQQIMAGQGRGEIGETTLPTITVIPPGGSGSGSRRGSRNSEAAAALREAEAVVKLIEGLEHELAVMGKTEVEKAKANALRQAGASATVEQKEKIEELIEAIHREQEAIKSAEEMARFFQSTMESAFMSVIPVIETGNDALDDLLNTLIKVVAQAALFGSGPLGGLFGGGKGLLGGIFPFAQGGVAAYGRPQPMKTFARGGVSRTAAIFGEAGPEAAVPLPDGRRIPVDLRMPNGHQQTATTINMPIEINAPGADAAALARVEASVKELGRNIPKMVDQRVNTRQTRGTRP